jgi:hypothetical protein
MVQLAFDLELYTITYTVCSRRDGQGTHGCTLLAIVRPLGARCT